MTHMHVAGSIHADVLSRAPGWLGVPADVNDLLPTLWSRNVSKDAEGVLTVAGLTRHRDRRAGRHAGLRARRGRPAHPGPGLRRRPSPAGTSTTPASPSCAPRSPAGSPRRASASTCAPGASWRWPCGPGSIRARSVCTATTRATPSSSRPWTPASAGSSSTPSTRSSASAGWSPPADSASGRGSWCGSPPGSRRTPTSTSPPPTRTRSSASRSPRDRPLDALRACTPRRRWSWPASTPTSARRSSTPRASRSPPAGRCGCTPTFAARDRGRAAGAGPRRRLRHRLHQRRHPGDARPSWPRPCGGSSSTSAPRYGVAVPHLSIEPGRAISGPSAFALYSVGTVKPVASRRRRQSGSTWPWTAG